MHHIYEPHLFYILDLNIFPCTSFIKFTMFLYIHHFFIYPPFFNIHPIFISSPYFSLCPHIINYLALIFLIYLFTHTPYFHRGLESKPRDGSFSMSQPYPRDARKCLLPFGAGKTPKNRGKKVVRLPIIQCEQFKPRQELVHPGYRRQKWPFPRISKDFCSRCCK